MPAGEPTRSTGGDPRSTRLKITNWMEEHLGKAALPVAALAGAAALGVPGFMLGGPIVGALAGATGAFFGGVLFMSG